MILKVQTDWETNGKMGISSFQNAKSNTGQADVCQEVGEESSRLMSGLEVLVLIHSDVQTYEAQIARENTLELSHGVQARRLPRQPHI